MTDDGKRRLKKDLEEADKELEKLEAQEEEKRASRELALDEDIRVRSQMMQRDIMSAEEEGEHVRVSGDGGGDDDEGYTPTEPVRREKTREKEDSKREDEEGLSYTAYAMAADPVPSGAAVAVGATSSAQTMGPTGLSSDGSYKRTYPIATSGWGIIKEAMLRRWDSILAKKGNEPTAIYRRMWLMASTDKLIDERKLSNLRHLEDSSDKRLGRMRKLSKSGFEDLTDQERRELGKLEYEEASRWWLREEMLRRIPLAQQKEMTWLNPMDRGAFSVKPYTYMSTWSMLDAKQRAVARWYQDNLMLRWQHAIIGRFLPKRPKLTWFQRGKKGEIEREFEDVDEEIYSDKKFAELVKKGEAQLEDYEEELRGYDRFTVEEEKQIKKTFDEEIKELTALARLEEAAQL